MAENVADGRQSIIRLIGRYVVDVGRVGKPRRVVCDVSRQGLRVVHAREGLVERRRLDDALTSELLV